MTTEEYELIRQERPDLCLAPSRFAWWQERLQEYTWDRIITERTAQILAMGDEFLGQTDFFWRSVNDPDFK